MIRDQILQIVEDSANAIGYTVYDASVILKGENSRIIVRIDNMAVVSHADCERYSKELSSRLDESAILPNYSLEISSPGIKRDLRSLDEFRRFIGAPVKVVADTENGRCAVKGILEAVHDDRIVINDGQGPKEIAYNAIKSANLDY